MTPYILNVALILAGCVAFYKILLVKETFFRLNRFVLLACLALSFSLPLVPVPQKFSFRTAERTVAYPAVKTVRQVNLPAVSPENAAVASENQSIAESTGITFSKVMTGIIWLYWFGVAAFGINLLIQIITLLYRSYSRPVIRDGRYRIVELSGDQAPCSFGNNIFINPEKYDWDTYNQILLHEKIHIREGHTLDLLFAELVLIFQWFNPFAWMYRKEMENNLEFLTDQQLLNHSGIDQESYQLSLLKVSAPHFPLSITTNYNQSLLKKRVTMMNAKKSSVNTTWKYLFLVPFLAGFVCLLNKPVAGNAAILLIEQTQDNDDDGMKTEGAWFATIKDNTVNIQFREQNDDKNSGSGSTFQLSEFKDLPRDKSGAFSLKRDAGTIDFTGKFEGNQGMGRYKFSGNKDFAAYLEKEGIREHDEKDLMTYFMVNLSRSYIGMLKSNGYSKFTKNDLVPLAALDIDEAFIKMLKANGYNNLTLQEMIPLKALGIDGDYIKEIKNAGYPNVTTEKLITFKAQGINGKYIADFKKSAGSLNTPDHNTSDSKTDKKAGKKNKDSSEDDMVAFKALGVDADYVNSLKKAGYENLSNADLIPMKALGIDGEYIASVAAMGFKDVKPSDMIALKAQNVTSEYVQGIQALGFKLDAEDVIPLKALGVTPAYIKSFQDVGFKDLELDNITALKAQNISPALIKEYKDLGFEGLSLDDVIGAKATGTTPAFIKQMRQKGHKLSSLEKYITLKVTLNE